jgi:ABC-type Co2+ transport system permease subunit
MHIVDGVLSVPVLATGTLLTTGGVALGLRRLPVALVEGLLTGAAIGLMRRVNPDMLQGPIQASAW